MSFHVSQQGEAAHNTIVLEDESNGTKVQVYAFGALLNLFSIKHNEGERNVIDGFESPEDAIEHITPSFKSAKLSPYVCRLREGQYTFANVKHKVEKYYYQREALHGLLYDAVFSVTELSVDSNSAFVVLSYDYDKSDPGFPFFYRMEVTYRLQSNSRLSLTTRVINLSAVPIPMSDGWHPYFTFGKKVDDLELLIRSNEMVEFDSHLLPTGQLVPFQKFLHLQKIEDAKLDNSFVLPAEKMKEPACILRDPEDGLQLIIYPDESYPYLQVFIPEHRNSIAIENLSSLPDAFNNGFGLLILEPSASTSFNTSFAVTVSPLAL